MYFFPFALFLMNIPNLVLLAAAVIPAIFLMRCIYRSDRLEKEPWPLLKSLLIWGALSTFAAYLLEVLNEYFMEFLYYNTPFLRTELSYRICFFLMIGLIEEFCKYVVMKRRTWYSDAFNCQFDGVVYGVYVSLGFAVLENIKYVFSYGLGTALTRAITAVPGHAAFGVFMGAWYGIAKRYDNDGYPEKSQFCRIMAFFMPVFFHAAYDFVASAMDIPLFTLLFIIFVIFLFASAFIVVRRLADTDRYIA